MKVYVVLKELFEEITIDKIFLQKEKAKEYAKERTLKSKTSYYFFVKEYQVEM
jgi:hypothetical protein